MCISIPTPINPLARYDSFHFFRTFSASSSCFPLVFYSVTSNYSHTTHNTQHFNTSALCKVMNSADLVNSIFCKQMQKREIFYPVGTPSSLPTITVTCTSHGACVTNTPPECAFIAIPIHPIEKIWTRNHDLGQRVLASVEFWVYHWTAATEIRKVVDDCGGG